jgi:PAS domain S-box-containing protein
MPNPTLNATAPEGERQTLTDRLARLETLTGALGNARSVEQVAEVILTQGLAALDADAGILALLNNDGTEFVVAGSLGHPPEEVGPWRRFPADAPVPLAEAVRSRRPVVFETFAPRQARCPQTARCLAGGNGALVTLPLPGRDSFLGSLGLSFRTERSFPETDMACLRMLANLCALAVERLCLAEAGRAALLKAEHEVQERQREAVERGRFSAVGADMLAIAGFDGHLRWVGPAWERTLGWPPEELVGRPYLDFVHPDDQAATRAEAAKLAEGHETVKFENRYRCKDGSYRWFSWKACPYPSEQLIYGGATDVTEQKLAGEALREGEERFRLLTEVVPQLVWSALPDGRVDYCNPRWLDYTGLMQEQVQGDGWIAALHPDDHAETLAAWRRATETAGEHQVEQRLRGKSGDYRWFLTRALPLRDAAGQVIKWYGTCTDIEDRRGAEEVKRGLERKLLEAQKLESLGLLAGGIAHDFNNLLTPILGHASLMEAELPAESPLRQFLDQIIQASERAADLCRQMLAYSGRGRFVLAGLDLNQLVQEMVGLLRMSVSKKAELQLELGKDMPPVLADATQIRQVVMNLVLNASEAIGDHPGIIRMGTGVQVVDRAFLAGSDPWPDLVEGEYVSLEVADTGCGMDEETRRKVFDPFFTTKFTGRGLGLAAVLGIVRGHKGAIRLPVNPGGARPSACCCPRGGTRQGNANGPPQRASRGKGPARCWWRMTRGGCGRWPPGCCGRWACRWSRPGTARRRWPASAGAPTPSGWCCWT